VTVANGQKTITSANISAYAGSPALSASLLQLIQTQATETVQGTAKVATQALTNAGSDDATIVTPKKLLFGITIPCKLELGPYAPPMAWWTHVPRGTNYTYISRADHFS
jgi:hypothetical protein